MKFLTKYPVQKMSKKEFENYTFSYATEVKDKIVKYLKKFSECAFTSEPVKDKYTGEIVYDADNARSDGEYTWYESEIYHFEKYNLKLDDEFIDYVLNQVNK